MIKMIKRMFKKKTFSKREYEYKACGDCKFWNQDHSGSGWCHRYAPSPYIKTTVHRNQHPYDENVFFPYLSYDNFCGDYRSSTYKGAKRGG